MTALKTLFNFGQGHATSHGALLIGQSHSNPCIVPVPVVPGSRYPHSVSCVDVSQWSPWAQETLRHPPHIVDLDSISTLITNVEALNNFELKDNFVLYADCRGNPDADRNKFLSNLHYPSGKHYVRGSFLVLQTSRDGTVKDFELRNEALVLYLIRV